MKPITLIATTAAAALLAACATAPDLRPTAPAAGQGAFVGASTGPYTADAPPADWWRLYADPALDGLVEQALSRNRDLAVAEATLRQVRASLSEARSLRLPSTNTSASASYGRPAATTTPGAVGALEEGETYSVGLDVSYEIDLFGRVRNTIAAARADAAAQEAARDVVRVSVAAETARAYADACSANAQIAVAERTIALQQRTLDLTRTLLSAGRGTGLDQARAAAQLESTRATLPPLVAGRDEALFRLATLTGVTPSEASRQARECQTAPRLESAIPIGDGAGLIARRPDIRQAESQVAGAAARVGVATAALYPSISLGGSVASTALDAGDLGSDRSVSFGVGPLISWSFPNIVAARARIAAAEAGGEAALARFDGVVLNALQEVETSLSAYANALERRRALAVARERSAEAARLARLRFDAGVDSFLTVLDAERTLAATEAQAAQADAQVVSLQISLFKALGGGWERTAA
jgi:NodT family efflux transporter outer membrane factor (OMF) lipoprotein